MSDKDCCEYSIGDWDDDLSPEPDSECEIELIEEDDASMMAIGRYDIVGRSFTASSIDNYIASFDVCRKVNFTVVHNSATAMSAYNGLGTVRSFYNYHVNTRKWKSIGYHWIIGPDGAIWGGRLMNLIGAHAGAKGNPLSIGVCLVGNFATIDQPTLKAKAAFVALHESLNKHYYKRSSGTVRLHKEFMSTSCPGKISPLSWFNDPSVRNLLPSVTQQVLPKVFFNQKEIANGIILDSTTYVPLRPIAEGLNLAVKWDNKNKIVYLENDLNIDRDCSASVKPNPEKPAVFLDGKRINDGRLVDDRTYVPVRSVAEELGISVNWDNKNKIAYLKS